LWQYSSDNVLPYGAFHTKLTAEDIMVRERIAVMAETTIEEAVKTMEERHLHNFPVKKDGRGADSVMRHDLLRAWIGLGTSGRRLRRVAFALGGGVIETGVLSAPSAR
jgi:CBS-domain-containing membrane protein